MNQKIDRREFLEGVAAALPQAGLALGSGAATTRVLGWSSEARAWCTQAGPEAFEHVPHLEGEITTDSDARREIAVDVGYTVFHVPSAVLRPGSALDIRKMVRYCARLGIPVAMRGQGHSTNGQGQAREGLLIDSRSLNTIHEIGAGYAIVDAGVTWRQLVERTTALGQTPPVLTGYTELSIGGTLSMGGISGLAYDIGLQVEHVRALTVVTGTGRLVDCSRTRRRDLFDVVLAGIGQYGIIVRAEIELVPASARSLDTTLRYDDISAFVADLRLLIGRGEFDMVWGGAQQDASGWYYQLFATAFYDDSLPDVDTMLRGTSFVAGSRVDVDGTYLDYVTRVDGLVAQMKALGVFDQVMHNWFNVFFPLAAFEDFAPRALASLPPGDPGMFGFVLFFPVIRDTVRQPMMRVPEGDEIFILFDIDRAASSAGYDAAYDRETRARNRAMYEEARAHGAVLYPIGTMDMTRSDWARHYGREWNRARRAKASFDPAGILTPGPGIFSR